MLKFAYVIKEAGFRPCTFPRCSNINVRVFDGKNRERTNEVPYEKELFADNVKSANEFFNFLCFVEAKEVTSMDITIDVDWVTVCYNGQPLHFKRSESRDPINFMH